MNSLIPIRVTDQGLGVVMEYSSVRSEFNRSGDETPKQEDIKKVLNDKKPDEDLKLVFNGDDNLFPNNLRNILKKSPIYKVGLLYSAQQLMGLGESPGKTEVNDNKLMFIPEVNKDWQEFKRKSRFTIDCFIPAAQNIKKWYQVYVLFSINDFGKIAKAKILKDEKCRIIINGKNEPKYCAVGDWEKYNSLQAKELYPLIDGWYDPVTNLKELIKKNPKDKLFVYHIRIPSDSDIYALPDHFSVVESGLLDYANNIVNFKKWVMENLTRLDKILFISQDYVKQNYPQFENLMDLASKGGKEGQEASTKIDEIFETIATKFQESNSGVDKSGKTILAPLLEDGEQSIKVVKVDQNTFDSEYNADANWVEKQILWAVMVDSAQYSSSEGSTASGGSNKNQSYNLAQVNQWMFEQFLMEIPKFIADFNEYGIETFKVTRATMFSSDAISPKDRQTQDPTAA